MPQLPTIENQTGQPLSYEFTQVFQHMFAEYARVVIRSELTGGLSGGRVFLVRPVRQTGAERPSVVKIDETARIEREWLAYRDCIHNRLGEAAEIRGEPTYPRGLQWGGLRYPLVGAGTFDIASLQKYYQTASLEDIQHVLENRLFKSLETLWKDNRTVEVEYFLRARYDAQLPSNLVIEKSSGPTQTNWTYSFLTGFPAPSSMSQTHTFFLQPDSIHAQTLQVGDSVQLFGFRVIKVDRQVNQLSLNTPEGASFAYRLDLKGVDEVGQYHVGQLLTQPIAGVVRQTRADRLLAEAQKVLGEGMDFAAATLPTAHHAQQPNPFLNLPQILSRSFDVEVGYIHGDLNLENVLVEPGNRNAFLIDFALARKDHILHDPLRMELAVITKILPELFQQTGQSAEQIISFYERLHCAINQANPIAAPAGLEKPFAILQMIRKVAQRHLHNHDNWTEYYHGLVIYLLGALRFSDLDTLPTTPLPKQMAFWGAAAILRLIQEQPDCSRFAAIQSPNPVKAEIHQQVAKPVPNDIGNIQALQPSAQVQVLNLQYRASSRVILLNILKEHFNLTELQELCLEMEIDFDNLAGSSKADKARELLLFCERHGRADKLVKVTYHHRPNAPWDSFKS